MSYLDQWKWILSLALIGESRSDVAVDRIRASLGSNADAFILSRCYLPFTAVIPTANSVPSPIRVNERVATEECSRQ